MLGIGERSHDNSIAFVDKIGQHVANGVCLLYVDEAAISIEEHYPMH